MTFVATGVMRRSAHTLSSACARSSIRSSASSMPSDSRFRASHTRLTHEAIDTVAASAALTPMPGVQAIGRFVHIAQRPGSGSRQVAR